MNISVIRGGKVRGRRALDMTCRLSVWYLEGEDVACEVGGKVILEFKVRRGGCSWVGGEWRMLGNFHGEEQNRMS